MRDASSVQYVVSKARSWCDQLLVHARVASRWYVLLALAAAGGSAYALQPGASSPAQTGHALAGTTGTMVLPSTAADSQQEPSSNSQTHVDTSVTVNGQNVEVPDDGSVHKEVHSANGNTSVDITNSSSVSGSTTHMELNIESHSSSNGGSDST